MQSPFCSNTAFIVPQRIAFFNGYMRENDFCEIIELCIEIGVYLCYYNCVCDFMRWFYPPKKEDPI